MEAPVINRGGLQAVLERGSGAARHASRSVARPLARHGCRRVRRYAGGLADWAAAGEPRAGARRLTRQATP
jgi:hypothetical protein